MNQHQERSVYIKLYNDLMILLLWYINYYIRKNGVIHLLPLSKFLILVMSPLKELLLWLEKTLYGKIFYLYDHLSLMHLRMREPLLKRTYFWLLKQIDQFFCLNCCGNIYSWNMFISSKRSNVYLVI